MEPNIGQYGTELLAHLVTARGHWTMMAAFYENIA